MLVKGGYGGTQTALFGCGPKRVTRNRAMVISLAVRLKELFELGREYPWTKPDGCPKCGSYRLWGHGFVSAYFDGYHQPVWLKRYRCPDCGCVIRLRPKGYFRRFQASIAVIRASIESRACRGTWIRGIGRSRQRHWFQALLRRIEAYLTGMWDRGLPAAFDHLCQMGQIPVSRSI